MSRPDFLTGDVRVTAHRDHDDLLSAGLGLDGLAGAPSPFADPGSSHARPSCGAARSRPAGRASPTSVRWAATARSTAACPTCPVASTRRSPACPARVRRIACCCSCPIDFDTRRRCLVVAPSSGSRGVYGAIALAGAWGLPQGLCGGLYRQGHRRGLFRLRRRQRRGAGRHAREAWRGAAGVRAEAAADRCRHRGEADALGRQPGGRLGPRRDPGGALRPGDARSRLSRRRRRSRRRTRRSSPPAFPTAAARCCRRRGWMTITCSPAWSRWSRTSTCPVTAGRCTTTPPRRRSGCPAP